MDPKGESHSKKLKLLKNWKKFCSNYEYLAKINWKMGEIQHPIQKDGNNCGVFVCRFYEQLVSGRKIISFDNSLQESMKYRKRMCFEFKRKSKLNFCTFCAKDIQLSDEILKTACRHRYHADCRELNLENKNEFKCPICF